MRPHSMVPQAHIRGSSSSTSDVQTITLPAGCSAFEITVETTAARITLDGTDPSAGSAPSTVIQKDQNPQYMPVAAPAVVKWVSTAAAASVVQVLPLQ